MDETRGTALFCGLLALLLPWGAARTQEPAPEERAVEWGRVEWLRRYDEGVKRAKATGRPIMLLFDEVPGCRGCRQYGVHTLSHPIVVDAARELFVPVGIRNNAKGGHDREILERFGEKAWSYPVVRFLDTRGRDIIPRVEGRWRSPASLLGRMAAALEKAGRPVPAWLALPARELNPRRPARACFWMHCYWTGDRNLGGRKGVLATRIGMLAGREVVEVDYDAAQVGLGELIELVESSCGERVGLVARNAEQAARAGKAGMRVVRSDEPVDTTTRQKVHLARALDLHLLPLTRIQAARLNAAVAGRRRQNIAPLLSPTQAALQNRLVALHGKDPKACKRLAADLEPDRSPLGLARYTRLLQKALAP